MALSDAQYASTWYPAALGLVAAFVLFAVAGPRRALGRLQMLALGSAAAFALWHYLSLAWSGLDGPTLTEANRASTYAIALALIVLVADTPERRRDLLVLTAGVSGLLAVYIGLRLGLGADVDLFEGSRLFRPIGYPNTLAAFMMVGLWPLVTVAASPEESVLVRAAALAGAAAIPAAALLTVSRGGAVFAVLGAVVYFAVSPIRVRSLLATIVIAVPVVLGYGRLDAAQDRFDAGTIQAAGQVVILGALAGLIAGGVWALIDRRCHLPSTVGRALRIVLAGLLIVGVVGAIVVAVDRDAPGFADRRWEAFKAGQGSDAGESENRLLTSGSNRYDFWRVSLTMLEERPVAGFGAATWQWRYLLDGVSTEEPDNAHGAVFEFAAGLGGVGVALYLAMILLALAASILPGRAEDGPRQAAVLAAIVIGVGHMQIDWLWESAATGLLITALLGLALAAARRSERPPRASLRRLGLAAVVAVGAAGIAPALLAERYTDASYRAVPVDAIAQAERAASLNPFAAAPELARAAAARRAGDLPTVVAALRAAADREPRNWVAWSLLADAERESGDPDAANRSCLEAQHLKAVIECPEQSS